MATINEKILVGALIATIIIAGIIIALVATVTIHNTGTINTSGFILWADQNRTIAYSMSNPINWGTFNAGDTKGILAWAQNTGNINVTLSFMTWNWNPSAAAQYLIFQWNYTQQVLGPSQILPLQLTLQALANVTGITNFSFDINMTATQV